MKRPLARQFVICVNNEAYPAALKRRKIYVVMRDPAVEKEGLLRIIDESGEEYLYPRSLFRAITLPESLRKAVLAA